MGIPSWAVPGAKVVCVKRGAWRTTGTSRLALGHGERRPKFGDILTIREAFISRRTGNCVLRFSELVNPISRADVDGTPVEMCFGAHRFRPLVTQYTEAHDVAKLKHLLTSKEPADA